MMRFGYTLMTEQSPAPRLVQHAVSAEQAGFDFAVSSDHFFPWVEEQGHSPNAWVLLGAVAQATSTLDLMTYVTAPIMRYHPAVVAQQAATLGILSEGRFTLGLGAGENLNEHVIGRGWPPVNVRHEMFSEALDIIDALFDGGYVSYQGKHLSVDSAKLWDLPEQRVPVGVAVSGEQSIKVGAPRADVMISTEPDPSLAPLWDEHARGGPGGRKVAQLPIAWGADVEAAVQRAHAQFRWFAGGWKVNAELPGPSGFAGATQFVRPEDVAEQIPCGDDVDAVVEAVRPFAEAGYTDLALVQIGDEAQEELFDTGVSRLLPALREAFGS